MGHLVHWVVAAIAVLSASVASASQIRIDFSGTFHDQCIDCGAYETGSLRGTGFSGYVIIPDNGVAEPGEYYQGETVYLLDGSQAYFHLDAAINSFDVSSNIDMIAYVRDGECVHSCTDKFSLLFNTPDYVFELGFTQNVPGDPIQGEEIPSVTELQNLVAGISDVQGSSPGKYFSVAMSSWDGWVGNYDLGDTSTHEPLTVSVTAVPIPGTLALLPCALIWLFRFRGQTPVDKLLNQR